MSSGSSSGSEDLTGRTKFSSLQSEQLASGQVLQQTPTDNRDLGAGDLEFCQLPEPPDGRRESEGVVIGGGGGDDEAAGVDRNTVQGEVVLVMSSTLNLMTDDLRSR